MILTGINDESVFYEQAYRYKTTLTSKLNDVNIQTSKSKMLDASNLDYTY